MCTRGAQAPTRPPSVPMSPDLERSMARSCGRPLSAATAAVPRPVRADTCKSRPAHQRLHHAPVQAQQVAGHKRAVAVRHDGRLRPAVPRQRRCGRLCDRIGADRVWREAHADMGRLQQHQRPRRACGRQLQQEVQVRRLRAPGSRVQVLGLGGGSRCVTPTRTCAASSSSGRAGHAAASSSRKGRYGVCAR